MVLKSRHARMFCAAKRRRELPLFIDVGERKKTAGAGHKPNSVPAAAGAVNLSSPRVTPGDERPTYPLGRAVPRRGPFGLAPDGVRRAPRRRCRGDGLLPHLFTLALAGDAFSLPPAVRLTWGLFIVILLPGRG